MFTNKFLPKGVRFGPYVGKVVDKNEMEDVHDTSYVWEVCICKRISEESKKCPYFSVVEGSI